MKKNPTFGEFIRLARKEKRKLPLVALSKQIGISPAQLQRIEENQVRIYPDEKFLEKLSKTLDVDYETLVDLLYHHKNKKTEPTATSYNIPIVPWDFLTNIQNINPETIAIGSLSIEIENPQHAIAVKCDSSQWQPFISKGDILILLINTNPQDNDTFISTLNDGRLDIFKFSNQNSTQIYYPAFPAFQQTTPLTKEDNLHLIGILDRVIRSYR